MINHRQLTGLTLATFAIAIIALGVAIAAYDRAGKDLSDQIEDTAEAVVSETEETAEEVFDASVATAVRADATVRLAALETRIAAGEATEETAEEIAEIRADINEAYRNANQEAREEAAELERDLERLEDEVRSGTANALDTLEDLIARLENEVRYED